MKIKKLLLAFVSLFCMVTSFAQTDVNSLLKTLEAMPTNQPECGTDELMIRNPFLLEAFDAHRSSTGCNTDVDLTNAEILTIPIVFHVMHTGQAYGEGANITDEQIISAIDNLNERFRATPGALGVDEQSLDSKIEFCHAVRDPEGEPTDGITRHNLSGYDDYVAEGVTSSTFFAGMPDLTMKNIACWDPDLYLNVYIVTQIQGNGGGGGIQGYAYLGPTNNCLDGIVLLYNVTGTVGTLKSGRDENTTLPHEAGHYLSLYHTFNNGPDNCDYVESNCCTAGDRVCDTPVQISSANGCNSVCDSNPANYMDYTSQSCKTMFTEGQIERMRDAVSFARPQLVSEDNLACLPTGTTDIGITQLEMPDEWCQDGFSATLKINNFSAIEASGVTVSINGGVNYPVSPIDAGGFIIYTFSNIQTANGPDFEFEANWAEDENPNNNTAAGQVFFNEDLRWVEITVVPDVWSNELDWELIDESGEVVMEDGDWPVFDQEPKTKAACIPLGCYEFVMTDANGDGMCSFDFDDDGICNESYDAYINIFVDGNLVYELSDPAEINFGSELTHNFCVTNCPPIQCPGDLDGDGLTGVQDLLVMLTYVGQTGDCIPGDFDFDGTVGTSDVVELMLYFGETCFENPGLEISNYLKSLENKQEIIRTQYYNIQGVPVVWDADLPSGVYIIVETLEDGTIRSRKIYQFR